LELRITLRFNPVVHQSREQTENHGEWNAEFQAVALQMAVRNSRMSISIIFLLSGK